MQPNNLAAATSENLTALVSSLLGDLAFLVSDDQPAPLPPGALQLQCEVTYCGPAQGTLCAWCSRDFAVQLSANLLGTEPDETDAQASAEDALGELMNVLCGQFLTAWYGSEAVFKTSIPTVRQRAKTPQPPPGEPDAYCQISVSGEPFYCTHHQHGDR